MFVEVLTALGLFLAIGVRVSLRLYPLPPGGDWVTRRGTQLASRAAPWYGTICAAYFFRTMYRIVVRLRSLPTPMEMLVWWLEEPQDNVMEKVEDLGEEFKEAIRSTYHVIWNFKTIIMVVGSMVAVSYVLAKMFSKSALKIALRMRGFRLEAYREGSAFVKGKKPGCQVDILEAGLFKDKFIGYGIRFGDYLVAPRHVLDGLENMVLQGPKDKVLKPVTYIPSETVADIGYMSMTTNEWSRIGVTSARVSKLDFGMTVSCTGREGTSVGYLKRLPHLGMVAYTGSTVPGMSGAPYMAGSQVAGIHNGAAIKENVGVAIGVIVADMENLIMAESAHGHEEGNELTEREREEDRQRSMWDREDLSKAARANWAGRSAREAEQDRAIRRQMKGHWDFLASGGQGVTGNWAEESISQASRRAAATALSDVDVVLQTLEVMSAEQQAKLATAISTFMSMKTGGKIMGQSDDPVAVDIGPTYASASIASLMARVEKLESQMTQVLQEVGEIWCKFKDMNQKPTISYNTKKHIVCGVVEDGVKCGRMFKTDEAMRVHVTMKHKMTELSPYKQTTVPINPEKAKRKSPVKPKEVKPESALASDFKVTVKTTKQPAFLESPSPMTSGTSSEQPSHTRAPLLRSQLAPESLNQEQILLRLMSMLSDISQKITDGQSSGQMRS